MTFFLPLVENANVQLGRSPFIRKPIAVRSSGRPLPRSDRRAVVSSLYQLFFCSLDCIGLTDTSLCLNSRITEEQDHDELTLSWSKVTDSIGTLVHSSPLVGSAADEFIALRKMYQSKWLEDSRADSKQQSSNLLTPSDIQTHWEDRQLVYTTEQQDKSLASLDTQLKFVPAKTINELLALREDDTHPRNFIMVNSICFFADGELFSEIKLMLGYEILTTQLICSCCRTAVDRLH